MGGRRGARRAARRTVRRVDRRQDARTPEPAAAEAPPEQAPPPQAPQPQATEPAAPGLTAQVEELAKLKEQGLISDADYEAKKKQILGI
jgi:hypothetical protein